MDLRRQLQIRDLLGEAGHVRQCQLGVEDPLVQPCR
jgi:hypothetical protein